MATGGRSEPLIEVQISKLVESISNRNVQGIAIFYLGLDDKTLVRLKNKNRGDLDAFSRDIFLHWADKNSGPDQVKVFF